jgi:hypothetical protein
LKSWIQKTDNSEIPVEIKKELLDIVQRYRYFRYLYRKLVEQLENKTRTDKEYEIIENLIKKLEKMTKIETEIFKNLWAFKAFYYQKIKWFEYEIIAHKQRFITHLSQKLQKLKAGRKNQTTSSAKRNISRSAEKTLFSTLEFVLSIKKEIRSFLSNKISDANISAQILKQKKSHIKSILEYSRKDSNYMLTGELLTAWETELKLKFGSRFNRLKKLFDKYRQTNNILSRRHWVLYNHPNLKLDYFKNIDTLEKAYWFGLLFADGSVYLHSSKNRHGKVYKSLAISLQLSIRDGLLVKRFIEAIGFNPKLVKYQKRIVIDKKSGEQRFIRSFRVRFYDKLFAENMIKNGYILGKKSDKIRLPQLANRRLYLAFLLGFFDGDGKQGTTRITTNSKLFLTDIKNHFGIESKITTYEYKSESGEMRTSYRLYLRADLFNEMLGNYSLSLPRKRVKLIDIKQAHELQIPTPFSGPVKFKFAKKELKKLIQTMSQGEISELHEERFGIPISRSLVSYWCRKWDIKT